MSCRRCGANEPVLAGGNGSFEAQRLVGLCRRCAQSEAASIRTEGQAAVRQVLQQAGNWIKKNL